LARPGGTGWGWVPRRKVRGAWRIQGGVCAQDRALQLGQLPTGLDAQLVDEDRAEVAVRRQGRRCLVPSDSGQITQLPKRRRGHEAGP
jgi:hypothetical protein